MRQVLFISMLCMAIGWSSLTAADVPNEGRPNALTAVQTAQIKQHLRKKCSSANRKKNNCCSCQFVIPSKELNKGKGFVIDRPGVWCLDGNVKFNPKPSKFAPPDPRAVQAAITIKAGVSNVIIDLGSFRLTQAHAGSSCQTPFVIGILVPDPDPTNQDIDFVGAESIYIAGDDNAIIDGFSMYGIRIFAHTQDISLANLTIKNCGELAALGTRPTVYGFEYLPHTNAQTPGFGPSFGVAGLCIGESTAFGMGPTFFVDTPTTAINNINRINEVVLDNVTCLSNFSVGMIAPCITNVTIDNCHFNNTWSNDPGRTAAPAYNVIPAVGTIFYAGGAGPVYTADDVNGNIDPCCMNMVINDTTFNSTTLQGDFTTAIVNGFFPAVGALNGFSRDIVWNNCEFNGSTNTFVGLSGGGITAGCASGGTEDNTFVNCHFDNATSLSSVDGFHTSGTTGNTLTKSSRNTQIINCTASNLQFIGDQQLPTPVVSTRSVVGFQLTFVKDCVVENCVSQDIVNNGPVVNSFNAAFAPSASANQPQAQVENLVFRNCVAGGVHALNGGHAIGFNMFVEAGNSADAVVYENCISTGNQTFTPTLTTPGIAQGAGIGFLTDQNNNIANNAPTNFINCVAVNNKGLPSFSTAPPITTYYSSGFQVIGGVSHIFDSCKATDNIYGFILTQGCSQCVVRNCESDNNSDDMTNTGEGFTDLGTGNNQATQTQSFSIWESNRAYGNGMFTHVGQNGNYNIWMDSALTLRPPLLRGQASTASYTFTDPSVTYFSNVHNNSIIP